ncbi:MAG: type VI secretion system tip protein TssI/VgrG [Bryobacteraceae bacterium]
MKYTQKGRLISIESPLGADVLLLLHFTCVDRISELFTIKAHVMVERENVSKVTAQALVGKPVAIRMEVMPGKTRHFHGIVRRLVQSGREEEADLFRLDIVPWYWRLTARHDCRIFQAKTIPEIVEEVFNNAGMQRFTFNLQKPHLKWDYCVQYRESDWDFVNRVLEEEGIFYFFEQKADGHDLILSDNPNGHKDVPFQAKLDYIAEAGKSGQIASWETSEELRPGLFTLRDHHFQLPAKNLNVAEPSTIQVGDNSSLEIYDYPGEYAQLFQEPEQRLGDVEPEGERIVRIRMEQEEAAYNVSAGTTSFGVMAAGHTFEMARHFKAALNAKYVITSVQHSVEQTPAYDSGDAVGRPYAAKFTCIPFKIPYRPARRTRKPFVRGPQTAVVVGPPGEEIYVDKFGRVKVQFFWDRKGQFNDKSTCFLRVATPWAGQQWGMIHIPRVGQEVVVSFLEGDPDQPMVMASVYNSDMMPPYDLPANKTQSGIKSRSSPNGSASNFNEIRFEDKKDKEEIYVHAERNLKTIVEASESRSVGGSRTTTIHKDDKLTVEEGNLEVTVEKKDRIVKILEGNDSLTVSKGNTSSKTPLGTDSTEAKDITITAKTSIKIVCGGSSIEMTPGMITVKSPLIKLN